jgi:hypothetical protein
MITTWYLHSHLTWDSLCHSCKSSSFLTYAAFPEGGAYAIFRRKHAGSLEALRVTRPEAVGLARTKASTGFRLSPFFALNLPLAEFFYLTQSILAAWHKARSVKATPRVVSWSSLHIHEYCRAQSPTTKGLLCQAAPSSHARGCSLSLAR